MTGFGAARGEAGSESLTVELRSVNAKFCEVKARFPRELNSLEAELVKAVKARIQRGSIDAFIRRENGSAAHGLSPQIDFTLATAYVRSLRALRDALGLAGEPSINDIAGFEGVMRLGDSAPDLLQVSAALQQALGEAITALEEMRAREGEALGRDLGTRFDTIERNAQQIAGLVPQQVEAARERLQRRIAELTSSPIDPARLAQEVALIADRTDVAEELTRLASHVSQARGLIAGDAPAGRKLEFLVQEVNREINTIGSKSQHAAIAALVVEMKAELERVREQVQNVE
jgi:uncharacterized protein (TIGR00255 family)